MELSRMGRVLTTAVIFVLAGCGGGGSTVPQGAMTQSRAHQGTTSSGTLLYAVQDDSIEMLTYPQGTVFGTIHRIGPWGLCSDTSGDVWVTTDSSYVYEYAHGGKRPIAKLDTGALGPLTGCSVDPRTGNLAVVAYESGIFIFPNATGSPGQIEAPIDGYKCAYETRSATLYAWSMCHGMSLHSSVETTYRRPSSQSRRHLARRNY
jgi:hypothetical protein